MTSSQVARGLTLFVPILLTQDSMAGRKRTSDADAVPSTRASKAAKTDPSSSPSKTKGGKKASKAALPASTFKARALPLHLNLTHTPPSVDETVPAVPVDPGFIGATTLVPSSFSTGSYGWKGSKRLVVELQNSGEEAEDKEKEKVHVMLTINATVVGSKQAKEEFEGGTKGAEEDKEGDETKDVEVHEETSQPAQAI